MPNASQTIVIERTPEQIFAVLLDFTAYPKIFSEVKETKVLKNQKNEYEVAFTIDMMEPIACIMCFQSAAPLELRWNLVQSDMLKKNQGSWCIAEIEPGVSEVTYSTDVELKIWVPEVLLQGVVQVHLPNMLQSLKQEVEKRYA